LRDLWALVLEGTSRAELQVHCAPFVVLDASGDPVFVMQFEQPVGSGKMAGNSISRRGVGGMYIDGSSSCAVWAAAYQQLQTWPRVAIKRRIADAAAEKGGKELSSTQLLLAQLISGGTTVTPLQVANSSRLEMASNAQACACSCVQNWRERI
jgi:hypothetical protein